MVVMARRLANLHLGLLLFGLSIALMVRSQLGLASWDVLHQGIAQRCGLRFGVVVIAVAVVVLLLWVPLHQRPGFGTLSNVVVVGLAADLALDLLPSAHGLAARGTLLAAGILINGVATGLYIGAGLGPGPRDGLMTGLAARGCSIRTARTAIEISVLVAGWLLGGSVGVGTVLYAASIGPLVHYLLPKLTVPIAATAVPTPTTEGRPL
ncbi:MAG: hypothetical protein DLM58_14095 [Pseudonocardiales bacterium]|nr:MAG: hypothetical protein DLM58_14095 [Pseudonocardiales bacterium]